jgi:hypothetical protein
MKIVGFWAGSKAYSDTVKQKEMEERIRRLAPLAMATLKNLGYGKLSDLR